MIVKSIALTVLLLLFSLLIYPGSEFADLKYPFSTEWLSETVYQQLNDSAINRSAFYLAMAGYTDLKSKGYISNDTVVTIIDYSKPSTEKRFFVIHLRLKKVIFKTLVAHGRNSGELHASGFSNQLHSYKSAIGFFITGKSYKGSQGYSLEMLGVDTGFNENARKRSVVIHGADYVSDQYILQYGRLGRSFGCPALPRETNKLIIDLIKNGSLIFSYFPDDNYLHHSRIIARLSFPGIDNQMSASSITASSSLLSSP